MASLRVSAAFISAALAAVSLLGCGNADANFPDEAVVATAPPGQCVRVMRVEGAGCIAFSRISDQASRPCSACGIVLPSESMSLYFGSSDDRLEFQSDALDDGGGCALGCPHVPGEL